MPDRRTYPKRPIVGIGVVVWRQTRLLLIRRGHAPRKGQWSLPGGAQALGETMAAAAAREVLEETSIRIAAPRLVDVIDSIETDPRGRIRYHYTLIDFTAEWQAGELAAGSDAMDARWVEAAELGAYELWPETVRIIALAARLRPTGT